MLALTGCGGAVPPVTVQQMLANCDAYRGKPVQLAGYLGECAGYECHLAADKTRYDTWVETFNATRGLGKDDPKLSKLWPRIVALWPVGVGGDDAFDRKAAAFQKSYVVIVGSIAKDTCTGEGGTDRSPGILPTDIRAWTQSEGAPANTE